MSDPKSRQEVLDLIRSERESLESILSGISEESMLEPGVQGNWSGKDLLAHVAVWEQRMVRWIRESLRGETPEIGEKGFTWDNLDRLNEQTYQENKDRPLDGVLAEFHASHEEALATVEGMTEEDLFDGERFVWRAGDPLLQMVAANTWWHYREHREHFEHWVSKP